MKKILRITAILLLLVLLLLPSHQYVFCQENHISWKFEPHTDGYVHIEAVVFLRKSTDSYRFLEVPEEIRIENVKVYEYESGDPIEHEVYYDSKMKRQTIVLSFSQPAEITCGIEFDLMGFIERRKERTFIFEWWYKSEEEESHTGVVSLPKGVELLELKYLEPVKVEEGEEVAIYYEGKSGPSSDFRFQLAFSSSGKTYLELGERHQEEGKYGLAVSYYQKAKSFYEQFDLYADGPALLGELQDRILAMQKIQADTAFQKGLTALDQMDPGTAKSQFERAENLYRILEDAERESQCREMLNECERLEALKEAEAILEQGKMQFGNLRFSRAEESFIQAKDMFEELGDVEKVSECEEWLNNVDEIYQTILVCIVGAIAISLALWQRSRE